MSVRPLFVVAVAVAIQATATVTVWGYTAIDAGVYAFLAASAFALLYAGWLVSRVPDNRITWLLLLAVACFTTGQVLGEYAATAASVGLPAPRLAALVGELGWWPTMLLVMVLLPLLFPTGSLLSPRWRAVAVAAVFGTTAALVAPSYDLLTMPLSNLALFGKPGFVWSTPSSLAVVETAGQSLVLICALAAVFSEVVRYRRAVVEERLQIKWVLLSIGAIAIGLFGAMVIDDSIIGLALVGLLSLPVTISFAILRYRLFDVDRLINRTVVYALVVGVLGVVFVAGAVWLPSLLPFEDNVAVAASTLAVFFMFNPLRRRVQRLVDRRFFRARYDAQQVADAFSAQLRDQVDTDQVTAQWVQVVQQTLQPESVSVWVAE